MNHSYSFGNTERYQPRVQRIVEKTNPEKKKISPEQKKEEDFHPNRSAYLNQETVDHGRVPDQVKNSSLNIIELGRKSKSKSRSSSPNKSRQGSAEKIDVLKKDGTQLYKNVTTVIDYSAGKNEKIIESPSREENVNFRPLSLQSKTHSPGERNTSSHGIPRTPVMMMEDKYKNTGTRDQTGK